jgi:hypothetical protein
MERVIERCCGLDVHKKTVVAGVRVPGATGARSQFIRTFGTTAGELLALRDWLEAQDVTEQEQSQNQGPTPDQEPRSPRRISCVCSGSDLRVSSGSASTARTIPCRSINSKAVSPVPVMPNVTSVVVAVVVRLAVRALPRAPTASVVAGAPAPLAVPAPDAVRRRVVVRVNRVNHDARDRELDPDRPRPWHCDAGRQQQRNRSDHHPSRLHRPPQF